MITLKEHLIRQKVLKKLFEDAVDLGLPSGTLWCSHNVGAEKPEDAGDYFGWGETESKEIYSWQTYKLSTWNSLSLNILTKYNENDHKTVLDLEDDAAHVNMGGNWHIPSNKQIKELISETQQQLILKDNIGVLFTSKKNNNSIFIPYAGYYANRKVENKNKCFYIWSNQCVFKSQDYYLGYDLLIYGLDKISFFTEDKTMRHYGHSVRPVIDNY